MKTPREVLLAQHENSRPQLDAIRRSVVERELAGLPGRRRGWSLFGFAARIPNQCWRELIAPCRRVWTGLAAVWILIVLINFSLRETVSEVTGKPVYAPAVMMSWQAQQRLMSEILADRQTPSADADRPRNIAPRPRTEIHDQMIA